MMRQKHMLPLPYVNILMSRFRPQLKTLKKGKRKKPEITEGSHIKI